MAKWLGDGVMLVGTEAGPLIAAVGELALRLHDDEFDIHAGIADGTVLLFEGDDYVGRPVNLAAPACVRRPVPVRPCAWGWTTPSPTGSRSRAR